MAGFPDDKILIIGVDCGRPGADLSVLMARIDAEITSVIALAPELLRPSAESTARQLEQIAREAAPRLNGYMARFNRLVAEKSRPPRRKKWDQYGSYHRRQVKKWQKKVGVYLKFP